MIRLQWVALGMWGVAAMTVSPIQAEHQTAQQMFDRVGDLKPISEVIRTAEKETNGKAIGVILINMDAVERAMGTEKDHGAHPHYLVNIVNGNQYLDVVVCAKTGELVSKKEMGATRTKPFAMTISSSTGDAPAINYFAAPKLLQKASELTGKEVKNPQGEKLGKLEELTIDPHSGRILYGVLSFGGLLGIGDKLFAIPWPSLRLNPGTDHFVLSVTKDRLKLAEGFDKSAWPNMADQRWATQTHSYYGQEPYWNLQTTRITTTQEGNSPNEIRTRDEYRRRWFAPTTGWVKAHDLMGKNAKTAATSEPVGELYELMIDPDAGRVVYGILKFDGKYFAIPWMAWSNEPGFDYAVLNVTKDRLKVASSFENNAWPNLADLRRAREIHGFYGYPVYWEDADDIVITTP